MRPKTHNRPTKEAARMEISNNDLARILGNIEAKVDVQMQALNRHENSLIRVEKALNDRADGHDARLRTIEQINPAKIAEAVKDHNIRINALEKGAARTAAIAGIGSSLAVAAMVEFIKRKLGQ